MTPTHEQPLWTIDDLSARVAQALSAVDYQGPPNGRVRDVPDLRTIRYYTTLGLIDRPAAMRGRTALYGRRHLMQLVAIKRLQARGLSLVQIQEQLVGLPDAKLSRLAALPEEEKLAACAPPIESPADDSRSAAFWTEEPDTARHSRNQISPSPPASGGAPWATGWGEGGRYPAPEQGSSRGDLNNPSCENESVPAESVSSIPAGVERIVPLHGLPLAQDVILLFGPARSLNEDDLAALRQAAAPLLKLLHTRRLLRPGNERGTS